jgi:glutathione S-transferase
LILYEHPSSGNCLKARVMLDQVGADYERVVLDLFAGETRTPEHFARNPDGRIPVLELDSGECIAESGAILLYLAEGTPYLPEDRLARAPVHQWMFFEQNQIEALLAVTRFIVMTGRAEANPQLVESLLARGRGALAALARGLADERPFITGEDYTVADIALYAYVHCAADAGADAREHDVIAGWLDRVEATPRFENDLGPFPEHAIVTS